MDLNPYEHLLVTKERGADKMREAERWRLIKSLREDRNAPGRLQALRLSLGRLVTGRRRDRSRERLPHARRTISSSTR